VYYKSSLGDCKVVDGVGFTVKQNEIFGIAGESGCGKSTLIEGILRILPPGGYVPSGKVFFNDVDLLNINEEEMRTIRFKQLAYVPQGSMNALNPIMRIEDQILDAILAHEKIYRKKAKQRTCKLLENVGLPPETARMYPHELSGGMKQRVCIAMAKALEPKLIIADEPTTALDVNVQRLVLQSIIEAKENLDATIMIICHDMGVHAEIADRLAIMYAGKICEIGDVDTIFNNSLHPYVKKLIDCIPSLERRHIEGIPGTPPTPLKWPSGCRFHPRCPYSTSLCEIEVPELKEVHAEHFVACHLLK
jgi:peptide/nickel transport system ATP-binding protein